ncbi:hypothetical protein ACTHGU_03715 [Chitinophagaceae bacterium MMS25-I14]
MSVEELKTKIISRIEAINDQDVIQYVYDLLQSELGPEKDHYELTPEQLQIVEEARAQYRRGEFLTDEEAEKDLDEWFEK